ncbi:hypothetical protein fHeYen901_138 [Yersinia phage fHe-Yen9-01]|uniref:Lysozyme n=1 Tax=Yersinia phage fHe-Yen9-01 TaxID=1965363 RepID=A0A1V0DXN6_9CAUD|nr:hypothetical protein KNT60_gp137 [Yersinia phage fHe-Yen9-01]ARB05911.1 hypothetical protein fHeYen901_138 [Yersinia phage fHe-Yen9-01]
MNLFEMLRYDEGLKLEVYFDTEGYPTVGVGHLLTKVHNLMTGISILDKELGRSTQGRITTEDAEYLFSKDVEKAKAGIKSNTVLNDLYLSLDSIRQMALVNMVFQMGVAGVAGFNNSIKLLKAKQWDQAALNLAQSRWFKQTPNRAKRVIDVFKTGTMNAYK